jgi:hypothetical protein
VECIDIERPNSRIPGYWDIRTVWVGEIRLLECFELLYRAQNNGMGQCRVERLLG